MIRHYYHLYLDGDASWEGIAAEYADALRVTGFPVPPNVGLVGRDRAEARRVMEEYGWPVIAEADTGFEQVTLQVLQDALPGMDDGDAVLYTHGKGASNGIPAEVQWRRSMLWHLVAGWRDCVALLADCDAAGCHWQEDRRFFAGNFWWARTGYLKTLPPLAADRFAAETWIGQGRICLENLAEGIPPDGTEEGALAMSALLPVRWIRRRWMRPSLEDEAAGR